MIDFLPDYILFAIGLGLLLGSAELLVRNAAKIARLIGKSSLFIGLTVTAFGTSAPELVVGISGQLSQNSDVGLGNIVGSNIFNIFFVLGLAAVIRPIVVQRPVVWRDIPILLIVCVLFFLFALSGAVGSIESIVLLAVLAIYLSYLSRSSNERLDVSSEASSPTTAAVRLNDNLVLTLIFIIASIAVMVAAAYLVVTGAISIARNLGISELVSGLTIVAIGTSLPEIVTTIAAVRNNEHELAIGNVMGSCFFNIVAVPAVMALIGTAGLSISSDALTVDIPVMILAVFACLPIFFSGHRISRSEGLLFLIYCSTYFMLLYLRSASDSFLNRHYTEMGVLALSLVSITFVIITVRALQYRKHHKEKIGP